MTTTIRSAEKKTMRRPGNAVGDHKAEIERPVEERQGFHRDGDDDGGDDRTGDRTDAAEHDDGRMSKVLEEDEPPGRSSSGSACQQAAGDPGEEAGNGEGQHLHAEHVDAHRLGGDPLSRIAWNARP